MLCLLAVRILIDLPFNFRLRNIAKRYFSPSQLAVIDLSVHTLMPIEIFMICNYDKLDRYGRGQFKFFIKYFKIDMLEMKCDLK